MYFTFIHEQSKMELTHCVMMEILRYRPPATMVPHQAMEDFQLTDDYKVPKGSIVIPSVLESAFQGWSNPHTVLPFYFFRKSALTHHD